MKYAFLLVAVAMGSSAFASDRKLTCHNTQSFPMTVTLNSDVAFNGINLEKINLTIAENGSVIQQKSFPVGYYDPTYQPRKAGRSAIRLMVSEHVRSKFSFYFPLISYGKTFLASLGEAGAGYHGETEYYPLVCIEK